MKKNTKVLNQLKGVGFDISGEIVDAIYPMSIYISEKDISNGVSENPLKCTAAQCIQRSFGTKRVAMFLTTCYVQMPDELTITRYMVPDRMQTHIINPQDTGGTPVAGYYTLKDPKGAYRLSAQRANTKRRADLINRGLLPRRGPMGAWRQKSQYARSVGRWAPVKNHRTK